MSDETDDRDVDLGDVVAFTPPDKVLPLFNSDEARRRRDAGMEQAADNRARILELAKKLARDEARVRGTVTIDDVQRRLAEYGLESGDLGMAAGSVFKGGEWQSVGWKQSTRSTSHARPVRQWRLKPTAEDVATNWV